MTMMKRTCHDCKKSHFDYYICGGCGQEFSCVWPRLFSHKRMTFCPLCGTPFGHITSPRKLEEYKP
jgi:DNA-directed RNA polymerase subunit RPC12/RpoP